MSDIGKIERAYKLGGIGQKEVKKAMVSQAGQVNGTSESKDARKENDQLEVAILGLMALRGAT